eukprot:gb/GFBE01072890.1/.p1 GENE.gb/GFBE01072890.1/~~gb/GFBE01072890.1/.p1  ORF type:complete len:266 (+),score=49.53 gb/GFBE01072890.1/:1-798(+)
MAARKGSFTGQLSALAQRRLTKEKARAEADREELQSAGIFTSWGDELQRAKAMIVGPAGTPYEGGFYFFDVHIPDDYPMHPPHVDFKTGDGRVRFNPNLYVEGKVCLSILGTWSGPSWTTSCTLRTVLVSIQSLLNEHPIQNEPGHEQETGKNDELYSEIIRYENIAVAVVKMLKNTPEKFVEFRPHMRRIFLQHVDKYLQALEPYKAKEGGKAKSPIWGFQATYRVAAVIKEIEELKKALALEPDEEEPEASSSEPASKRARSS